MAALGLSEVSTLVRQNNRSTFLSNSFVVCLIWKESGFRSRQNEDGSSANGLMQMTRAAIADVNHRVGDSGPHYTAADMSDHAKNIQCGTIYLDIRISRLGGNVEAGVNAYGTGSGYGDALFRCEKCLTASPASVGCLVAIHP